MSDSPTTAPTESIPVFEEPLGGNGLDQGAWDALPSDSEATVDYNTQAIGLKGNGGLQHGAEDASQTVRETVTDDTVPEPLVYGGPNMYNIAPTKDCAVDIHITTPDGRRISVSEVQEYELDDDGQPLNWTFDDAQELLQLAASTAFDRVTR